MKLPDVLKALKANSFTCSTGAQLLAEQPTADEVSHAHIHSLDPFHVDVTKIKTTAFQAPSGVDVSALAASRKTFWENPEVHLNPKGSNPYDSAVFDPAVKTDPVTFKPYEFYVDQTKLATNDTYLKRGMTEIAEKTQTSYSQKLVYKEVGAPKPTSKDFPLSSKTDKAVLPAGATLVKDLGVKETTARIHPMFQAMEAHSMFEDSEVLVMSTTAVLLSDAGLVALTEVEGKPAGAYIAVFSASAVTAVETAFAKNKATAPLKIVERSPTAVTVNTAGSQPKVETSGATYKKIDMKRAVLVVKKDATDDLIIVTCYPSQ
ncbi:MAG: hypothetical protein ACRD22_21570, partial [Terriglobia bacterium]